jgi:hypothetical protein
MPRESRLPHSIGRDSWRLPLRLALPVRPEQVFVLLIATGECAVMCVMERLADAPREMGVGRGDDHPFGCFGLVLDLDNSNQRMFGFDTGLFIAGEPENLVPVRGDKLTGEQQHSAGRAVPYPFTGRALGQEPMSTGLCGRPLCTHDTPTAPGVCPSPYRGHASGLEPIDLSCLGEDVTLTYSSFTRSCERSLIIPSGREAFPYVLPAPGVLQLHRTNRMLNLHVQCHMAEGCVGESILPKPRMDARGQTRMHGPLPKRLRVTSPLRPLFLSSTNDQAHLPGLLRWLRIPKTYVRPSQVQRLVRRRYSSVTAVLRVGPTVSVFIIFKTPSTFRSMSAEMSSRGK